MEFGDAVKARRQNLGLSQTDVSDKSGISKAMLSEIESGKKNPTLRVACAISDALDCQISDLLDVPPDVRFTKLDPESRRVLIDPDSGVERHLLAPPMVQHGIQVLLFVFPPGSSVEFDCDGQGVIEHATCVRGKMLFERVSPSGTESAEIEPGESVNYASDCAHRFTNLRNDEESRIFLVIDSSRRGQPVVFEGR